MPDLKTILEELAIEYADLRMAWKEGDITAEASNKDQKKLLETTLAKIEGMILKAEKNAYSQGFSVAEKKTKPLKEEIHNLKLEIQKMKKRRKKNNAMIKRIAEAKVQSKTKQIILKERLEELNLAIHTYSGLTPKWAEQSLKARKELLEKKLSVKANLGGEK